jgi:hypothetical protein
MNLWDKLEQRVRKELNVGEEYFAYAVDLKTEQDIAEVKLAPKSSKGNRYLVSKTITRYVKYMDLR